MYHLFNELLDDCFFFCILYYGVDWVPTKKTVVLYTCNFASFEFKAKKTTILVLIENLFVRKKDIKTTFLITFGYRI